MFCYIDGMSVESFLSEFNREFNTNARNSYYGHDVDGLIVKPDDDEHQDISEGTVRLDVYKTAQSIELSEAPDLLAKLAQRHEVNLSITCVSDIAETSLAMKQHFMAVGFKNAGTEDFLMDDETRPLYGEHLSFQKVRYNFEPPMH